LDEANGKEEDTSRGVGFRFRDGYNFGATARRKAIHSKGIPHKAAAAVAVEADAIEVRIEARVVSEDDVAVIETVTNRSPIFIDSIPVPDGEIGAASPGAHAAEAQRACEAGEIDGGIGAERELSDCLLERAIHSKRATIKIDSSGVVDGIGCCHEKGAAVV